MNTHRKPPRYQGYKIKSGSEISLHLPEVFISAENCNIHTSKIICIPQENAKLKVTTKREKKIEIENANANAKDKENQNENENSNNINITTSNKKENKIDLEKNKDKDKEEINRETLLVGMETKNDKIKKRKNS